MNTRVYRSKNRTRRGGSLLYILLLTAVTGLGAASLMSLTSTSVHLTRRNNERIRNLYVAIAGAEWAKERLNYLYREHGEASEEDLMYNYPPFYYEGHEFYDRDWMPGLNIYKHGEPVNEEVQSGNFQGMQARRQAYQVSSTCRAGYYEDGALATVTEDIMINALPLGQFAVFYEEDLEILPGPDFTITGWVHSNGNLHLGSHNNLNFDSKITAVGDIHHYRKNDGSVMGGNVRMKDNDGNYQSMRLPDGTSLDSNHPDWASESVLRWDNRVRSRDHGVPQLKLPIDIGEEPHDIIERANAADSPQLSDIKFENKADLRIIHDGATVRAYDKAGNEISLTYPDPLNAANTKSIVTMNTFDDHREGKTVLSLDVNIENLIESGVSLGDGVVYCSYDSPNESMMPSVRLTNGETLPSQGLTVASDRPVYIQGDYNTLGGKKSALVAGDAINILSNSWDDANDDYSERYATDTTVNTIVFTGNTETTWGDYNGGLENVLRFCEQWSGDTLNFQGSIVDMWRSEIATGSWRYGNPVYTAPVREWGFDPMYLDPANQPPGIPLVYAVETVQFTHRY